MQTVTEILSEGRDNAITAARLAEKIGVKKRELTRMIEEERRAGAPICAACGQNPGYFLAKNEKELQEYIDALYFRAGEIFKTRRALMKAREKFNS